MLPILMNTVLAFKHAMRTRFIHPFLSLKIHKFEIRQIAQDCGFDFWNKPSSSCLASRIPYGEEITLEKLQMVENAENIMLDMGFSNLRVRLHGKIARIELIPEEFEIAVNVRTQNRGVIARMRLFLRHPRPERISERQYG